ncbi:hypothetical protein G0Q06_06305 [Puniceicoccales bacterium CK1056]|uniref:Uncharacterized protein n=1 Tax=Oceanipulchritudo coccoides TaxID=2706888 RepID=A0A6B2M022_9BACT|nr:hypothetical protein [Oceanipulchritudo coccoides]NDV62053.1 hypothetical protein [Oceanipulchritudo coccoides]
MHSSTSNSDSPDKWPETYWRRPIPTAHWQGVSLLTALLVLAFLFVWETWWRLDGYEPSFEETAELWARMRDKAGTGAPDEVVYIGSSRIQFDFDMAVWQQDFGGSKPIALPKVGTCPRPFLSDIADDPDFKGVLICGVTELLFFAPDMSPPHSEATAYLNHRKNRPISSRTDFLLSVPLQSALASLNAEDLKLGTLLRKRWLALPNREGSRIMPDLPPYFARIGPDRRYHMWSRMEQEAPLQEKVQQIWLPWFTMGPPFAGEGLDALIESVRLDVEKIQARGGRVVFVRFPSSGQLRSIEKARWPREAYWDRLLEETGAPGIHFEDHESLQGFVCPEWSHLTRVDAVTFTRNLIPFIKEVL